MSCSPQRLDVAGFRVIPNEALFKFDALYPVVLRHGPDDEFRCYIDTNDAESLLWGDKTFTGVQPYVYDAATKAAKRSSYKLSRVCRFLCGHDGCRWNSCIHVQLSDSSVPTNLFGLLGQWNAQNIISKLLAFPKEFVEEKVMKRISEFPKEHRELRDALLKRLGEGMYVVYCTR
jgi:hypothetical protein